jgi:hypothetical protein
MDEVKPFMAGHSIEVTKRPETRAGLNYRALCGLVTPAFDSWRQSFVDGLGLARHICSSRAIKMVPDILRSSLATPTRQSGFWTLKMVADQTVVPEGALTG